MNSQGNIEEVRIAKPGDEFGARWVADQIIREFSTHYEALYDRLDKLERKIEKLSEQMVEADKKLDEVNKRCESRSVTCGAMQEQIEGHQAWIDYSRGKGAVYSVAAPIVLVAAWEIVKGVWAVVWRHLAGGR